jgi:uncharacterized lipoprotein YddW (UPF0748 family)
VPSSARLPLPRRARRPRASATVAAAVLAALGAAALVAAGSPPRPGEVAAGVVAEWRGGECVVTAADPRTLPTPPAVAREFRGAWVSPVDGGEWPSRPGMSEADQRAELIGRLDQARALGLNAVILHMRPAADALYPTGKAPWSTYLTGRGRGELGWDPLAVAVQEAHARGLQLHVWFNPFRASSPDGISSVGAERLRRDHPDWVVRYGSQAWIDPGIPAARAAVLEAILEVVDRYDVDAVHLDDYFYPYRIERTVTRTVRVGKKRRRVRSTETVAFDDDRSWERYGRASGAGGRADWRRENVSAFVESLYRAVKARKPWVLVGISPFGIWRSGYPRGVTGLDAYAEIYADSRRWLREGWVDYLAPQLYWALDGDQQRFVRLDGWWRQENPHGRHLWPGLLTMRTASRGSPWPVAEIPAEIDFLRRTRQNSGESMGHVHFRLGTLRPEGALAARLARDTYTEYALPPASPWLGDAQPAPPRVDPCGPDDRAMTERAFTPDDRASLTARVAPGDAAPVRWWLVQLRDGADRWSTRLYPGDAREVSLVPADGSAAVHAAVSAVSPAGVASAPRVVALP